MTLRDTTVATAQARLLALACEQALVTWLDREEHRSATPGFRMALARLEARNLAALAPYATDGAFPIADYVEALPLTAGRASDAYMDGRSTDRTREAAESAMIDLLRRIIYDMKVLRTALAAQHSALSEQVRRSDPTLW